MLFQCNIKGNDSWFYFKLFVSTFLLHNSTRLCVVKSHKISTKHKMTLAPFEFVCRFIRKGSLPSLTNLNINTLHSFVLRLTLNNCRHLSKLAALRFNCSNTEWILACCSATLAWYTVCETGCETGCLTVCTSHNNSLLSDNTLLTSATEVASELKTGLATCRSAVGFNVQSLVCQNQVRLLTFLYWRCKNTKFYFLFYFLV